MPTDPTTGRATLGGRRRRADAAASASRLAAADATATPPGTPSPSASPTASRLRRSKLRRAAHRRRPPGDRARFDDSQIPALFETQVRPALRGMTKAIYMGAHVGAMSGGALVDRLRRTSRTASRRGVPTRRREGARRRRRSAVTLSLVVDHGALRHDDNVVQLKRAEPAQADEDIDTDDLVDVPPDAIVSPIDRLTQAFPGSEIIEERT